MYASSNTAPTNVSPFIQLVRSPGFWLALLFVGLLYFGAMDSAHAADAQASGGAGLPWEGPLDKLKKSISGPVAFVVALLGIVACGAQLIWGGEVSEFTRRLVYIVLVVCVLVFANTLLTGALFTGATIPDGMTLPALQSAADVGGGR